VHGDPEILGATAGFSGIRVPLRNLIDCLEDGYTPDEFLDEFPSVLREQALEAADEALALDARSSPRATPASSRRRTDRS